MERGATLTSSNMSMERGCLCDIDKFIYVSEERMSVRDIDKFIYVSGERMYVRH